MEKIPQHHFFNIHARHYDLSRFFKLLNKITNIMFSWVTSEDTTDSIENNEFEIKKYHEYEILGGIKAIFWLVISFVFALLISQLK